MRLLLSLIFIASFFTSEAQNPLRALTIKRASAIASSNPPTYVNSRSIPNDNGTYTTNPIALALPYGLTTGDLVVFIIATRGGSASFAITNASNQTWNSVGVDFEYTSTDWTLFWCVYSGSASSDVTITQTAGDVPKVGVMHAFRSGNGNTNWGLEGYQETDVAATTTVALTGRTTTHTATVSLGVFVVPDDVTWTTITGTDWVNTSVVNQVRTTSGNDLSVSTVHKLKGTAGATGIVSRDQSTNGNDPCAGAVITFYEF